MKRWIILLIMVLVTIPLATAIIECKGVMRPAEVPCLIISTWQIPSCTTNTIRVFNSNSTFLDIRTLADYGQTGRCNSTWNYTDVDSYILNWSSGDSSKIIIEGDDEMASLSVTLFIGAITAFLIFMGLKFNFSKSVVANLIIKRCLIILGMFLLSLDTTIILTMADNAGLGISRELFRYLWMINWSIYLFIIFLMWTTVTNVVKLMNDISRQKRMGFGGNDEFT